MQSKSYTSATSKDQASEVLKELERLLILDSQLHDDEIVDESWDLLNHIKKTLVEASKAKREDK